MAELTQTKHYPFSPIALRKPLVLPHGARVAVLLYVNLEHFPEALPGTAIVEATKHLTPDVLNYGWRDYGARVGVWRLMDGIAKLGVPVTACLNSDVTNEYPEIIQKGVEMGWAWMGHGTNNSPKSFLTNLSEEDERTVIYSVLNTIGRATGNRPKGWLGPFMSESVRTPEILTDMGVEYLCDFTCDDQPFEFNVSKNGKKLIAMPYSLEINDLQSFLYMGISPREFGDMILDQFDVLYDEGKESGRFLPIALHAFIGGQAFRYKYIFSAIKSIAERPEVWLTTGDDVNRWFRERDGA